MQNTPHILIVDDDLEIRKLLGRYLTDQGYRVSLASDRRTMEDALLINEVSLIVLDVLLPDGSGLDICRDLRREGSEIPVIILTALKEDVDRIIGLEIGADDYLGKPFNPRELLARIRAVLRRKLAQEIQLSQVLEHRFGKFKLYPAVRQVLDDSELPLDLTGSEFELLLAMVRRPGRLLSRDQLLELTNRGSEEVFDRSVDVLMSRLRKKLGDNEEFQMIKTVRNGGYLFSARVETVGVEIMNSLRARITLMLVGSILCVVVLSTLVMSKMVIDLVEGNFRQGFSERVAAFAPSLTFQDNAAVFHLQPQPGPGEVLEKPTAEVKESFRKRGVPFDVVVKRTPAGRQAVSVNMGPGWLTWPVPSHTAPPRVWFGIAGWMGLIAIGVIGVALIVAHQTTKQLKFLETMAKAVGRDGILPRVREEGSAEIRATARALNMMGDSLKNAVETRMRLVAAAGHDLRTPMTRMRLRAEFLDDDERSQWLHDLDELDRIADSAIQLVREETVGKGTEPIRLDILVRQICQDLVLINFAVEVAGLDPVTVRMSPQAFTRALRNLVINAATHGGGAIVRVAASDARAMVVIDDHGPGIPQKDLSSVFEPFFRVDPARRKHIPGAGLGLAIAKEIIERQGGTLVVENRIPSGLRQTLSFERELAISPPEALRETALVPAG